MSDIFSNPSPRSAYLTALLCTFALLLVSAPTLGAKQEGRTVDVPSALEVTIDNRKRMTFQPRHLLYQANQRWIIEPGKHLVLRAAESEGKRYALVPLVRVIQPPNAYRNIHEPFVDESLSEKCGSIVRHHAAFDMETTVLEARTWISADSPCDHVDRWDRRFIVRDLPTDFYYTRHASIEEGEAAIAARRIRERQQEALERDRAIRQQEDRARENQLNAAAKRLIGATVCTVRNGMGHAGYTEQVSPDTGRIRIRVVRQFNPANNRFLLTSQPEQNVWEDPDDWYICTL